MSHCGAPVLLTCSRRRSRRTTARCVSRPVAAPGHPIAPPPNDGHDRKPASRPMPGMPLRHVTASPPARSPARRFQQLETLEPVLTVHISGPHREPTSKPIAAVRRHRDRIDFDDRHDTAVPHRRPATTDAAGDRTSSSYLQGGGIRYRAAELARAALPRHRDNAPSGIVGRRCRPSRPSIRAFCLFAGAQIGALVSGPIRTLLCRVSRLVRTVADPPGLAAAGLLDAQHHRGLRRREQRVGLRS